jgi:mono/diheme cytochrome c family protein
MDNRQRLSGSMIVAALLCMVPIAQAAKVQVWVLSPGVYGGDAEPPPTTMKNIELDTLPQKQVQRNDAQYGGSFHYRGVPLRELVRHYGPPAQADLMLLYFRNGMVVPLPFRDTSVMARLDPFVALEMGTTAQGPFSPRFPLISKHFDKYADIPQVMFSGNKLVVNKLWHPDVPEQATFSPWAMVDSLFGIGFAERRAYYDQFDPSPDTRSGFEIYRQSCQYCHGVNKTGAHFGLDFGRSIAHHPSQSSAMQLYYHTQYRLGPRVPLAQMPVLKHVSEQQATQLWQWLRAVSTAPPRPYSPGR